MLKEVIANKENYQPGLSTDCVIFGFHDNQLKVLLIKTKYSEDWALPGGFVLSIHVSADTDHVIRIFGMAPRGSLFHTFGYRVFA